jgi:hypothetical protein
MTRRIDFVGILLLVAIAHFAAVYSLNPTHYVFKKSSIRVISSPSWTLNSPETVQDKTQKNQKRDTAQLDGSRKAHPLNQVKKLSSSAIRPNFETSVFEDGGVVAPQAIKGAAKPIISGSKLGPSEQVPVDLLASHIRIPMIWRGEAEEGRAVARFSLDENGVLWLRALYGTPFLRAVLFENITLKNTSEFLSEALRRSGRSDFSIVLKFARVSGSYRTLNVEATGFEDGIEIIKTLPPVMRVFPGVAVSDSHAERAKEREKIEMRKFHDSPAFARTIADYQLTEGSSQRL